MDTGVSDDYFFPPLLRKLMAQMRQANPNNGAANAPIAFSTDTTNKNAPISATNFKNVVIIPIQIYITFCSSILHIQNCPCSLACFWY